MEKEVVPCVCGNMAELRRLPVHGVFLIKCACGKSTGADTELETRRLWNELMEASNEEPVNTAEAVGAAIAKANKIFFSEGRDYCNG